MSRPRIVRLGAAAAGCVVVLVALYAAWWSILAARWQDGIVRWTAAVAADGWTVVTGAVTVSGFPGPIRIDLATPRAEDAAGNAWAGPPSALLVSPFAPLEPRFAAPGSHRITLAGYPPVSVAADRVDGRIGITRGRPDALAIEARHLVGAGLMLDALHLDLRRLTPADLSDATAPRLGMVIGLDGAALPDAVAPVLDRTVPSVHLALRLRGAIPRAALRDALGAWRDAGGTVEIDSLALDWPPITAAGAATLALDKQLQPELAGSFTIRGLPAAIDRAVALGLMKPGPAIAAKVVLGLASQETPDGATENKLAVTVQDRLLSVGPIKLLQLPEVTW